MKISAFGIAPNLDFSKLKFLMRSKNSNSYCKSRNNPRVLCCFIHKESQQVCPS